MAGGQSALALRLLLAVFSSKISAAANHPFGDEVKHIYLNLLLCKQELPHSFTYDNTCSFVLLGELLRRLGLKLSWEIVQLKSLYVLYFTPSYTFFMYWKGQYVAYNHIFCLLSAPKGVELTQMEREVEITYLTFSWYKLFI